LRRNRFFATQDFEKREFRQFVKALAANPRWGTVLFYVFQFCPIPFLFATVLEQMGARMKVAQELLRHADIQTTMNILRKQGETTSVL